MGNSDFAPVFNLNLTVLSGEYAIYKLPPGSSWPAIPPGSFTSITETHNEVSVVAVSGLGLGAQDVETGWSLIEVSGPLDFGLTGVLHSLLEPLANAKIAVFVTSTYGTDYLLIKATKMEEAVIALRDHGHKVNNAYL